MKRKPNIATVAERAGVAVSTVSRYLNDRYVSQQARARIAPQIRHASREEIEALQTPPRPGKRRTFVDLR